MHLIHPSYTGRALKIMVFFYEVHPGGTVYACGIYVSPLMIGDVFVGINFLLLLLSLCPCYSVLTIKDSSMKFEDVSYYIEVDITLDVKG